jgi:hypothetical protein
VKIPTVTAKTAGHRGGEAFMGPVNRRQIAGAGRVATARSPDRGHGGFPPV